MIDVATVHRLHAILHAVAHGDRCTFNRTDGSAGVIATATGIAYDPDHPKDLDHACLLAVDNAGDHYVWSIQAVIDGYERGIFTTYSPEAF